VDCDQIFVMDAGRVIEHGTHEELLARRGAYYEMAKHQLQLDDETPAEVRRAA
jgi:ABC-type multidrug transport system fused ATPase/permease subunit